MEQTNTQTHIQTAAVFVPTHCALCGGFLGNECHVFRTMIALHDRQDPSSFHIGSQWLDVRCCRSCVALAASGGDTGRPLYLALNPPMGDTLVERAVRLLQERETLSDAAAMLCDVFADVPSNLLAVALCMVAEGVDIDDIVRKLCGQVDQ